MPRIVRLNWEACGYDEGLSLPYINDCPGEIQDEDFRFLSPTALPVAFGVCRDSRRAVLPDYPLCFASSTRRAQIRFNFDIDTLHVDKWICECVMILFGNMSKREHSCLRYLTVSDDLPDLFRNWGRGDKQIENCRNWLDPELEKFTSLEVRVAVNPLYHIVDLDLETAEELDHDQIMEDYNSKHSLTYYRTFPQSLIDRYNLLPDQVPTHDIEGLDDAELRAWILAWRKWSPKFMFPKFVWWLEGDDHTRFCG